ncbi:MAG: hypothetical protein LBB98_07805 [Treponema sp.]|jgi:hypothetical protein|nr:hypothetical protein [Treponema sp.]
MFAAPPEGWRRAGITEQRTGKDWAGQVQQLVDEDFPLAEKIILVMDNLNTHSIASLYETFPVEESKRWRTRATSFNFSEAGIYQNIEEFLTTKAQKEGIKHCLIHPLCAANRRFDFAFVVSLS